MKDKKLIRKCPECNRNLFLDLGNSGNWHEPDVAPSAYCACGYEELPQEKDYSSPDFDWFLETYTELRRKEKGSYEVWLKVGVQAFSINGIVYRKEELTEASNMRRMLAEALYRVLEENK